MNRIFQKAKLRQKNPHGGNSKKEMKRLDSFLQFEERSSDNEFGMSC